MKHMQRAMHIEKNAHTQVYLNVCAFFSMYTATAAMPA